MKYNVFVSCAKGLEYLLESETRSLGLDITLVNHQGVFGKGSLETLYQLCLNSRLANRVHMVLFEGTAYDAESIYRLCRGYQWQSLFSQDKTFAVEFHGTSDDIRNTMYGAQVIKDAIVDHFGTFEKRPNVSKENPNIRIQAFFKQDHLSVSFDLSGYSLHQRGYRLQTTEAPLKETLAAAILMRANWPALAALGYDFYDPFCGSGTLVIESAMMAAEIAPGLLRKDQSFIHWKGHKPKLWESLCEQARLKVKAIPMNIEGSDIDGMAIDFSLENAERAQVSSLVKFHQKELKDCRAKSSKGLLLCNPPYGERLGDDDLVDLYQELGFVAHQSFSGWEMAFLTSDQDLAKSVGLRSKKQYAFFNGSLKCKLYCISLDPSNAFRSR